MKEWWNKLWEGEDLSEMMVIVGLIGVMAWGMYLGNEGMVGTIIGILGRHLMGNKKESSKD